MDEKSDGPILAGLKRLGFEYTGVNDRNAQIWKLKDAEAIVNGEPVLIEGKTRVHYNPESDSISCSYTWNKETPERKADCALLMITCEGITPANIEARLITDVHYKPRTEQENPLYLPPEYRNHHAVTK